MQDGGPAFPHSYITPSGPTAYDDHAGMSLRDYFAARAMQGLVWELAAAISKDQDVSRAMLAIDNTARLSYAFADRMLAARETKF